MTESKTKELNKSQTLKDIVIDFHIMHSFFPDQQDGYSFLVPLQSALVSMNDEELGVAASELVGVDEGLLAVEELHQRVGLRLAGLAAGCAVRAVVDARGERADFDSLGDHFVRTD